MGPRDPDGAVSTGEQLENSEDNLSPIEVSVGATESQNHATKEMCCYCFDVLVREVVPLKDQKELVGMLHNATGSAHSSYMDTLSPSAACPLFITWEKRKDVHMRNGFHRPVTTTNGHNGESAMHLMNDNCDDEYASCGRDYELRGCIGTLAPRLLSTAIREYALTSAFRDRRFDPVRIHEIQKLRVSVSLLVNYEDCSNCYDWIVGVHGILIKFSYKSSMYSSTYLPEVAKEQGWNHEDAIRSLIRKAGFRGQISESLINEIECTRYQSSKKRLTYQDYVQTIGGNDPLAPAIAEEANSQRRSWRSCFNF